MAPGIGQFGYTALCDSPPAISGYEQAAATVIGLAPADSTILFSGYWDGAFVFDLRARDDARRVGVLRCDKLLLQVKAKRELGGEQLSAGLNRFGVGYVVNEPEFWEDLEAMRVLQDYCMAPNSRRSAKSPSPALFRTVAGCWKSTATGNTRLAAGNGRPWNCSPSMRSSEARPVCPTAAARQSAVAPGKQTSPSHQAPRALEFLSHRFPAPLRPPA